MSSYNVEAKSATLIKDCYDGQLKVYKMGMDSLHSMCMSLTGHCIDMPQREKRTRNRAGSFKEVIPKVRMDTEKVVGR
ncbi:hypothetical protein C5167_001845 [Papaver somniferum]|uniref:Uncharacterized protein n=1 Tax=Papaver somniferum TaxID=3469 RepID=A0A4Y7L0F9_PAPSO|nr:hypothetical protein C5167_001845 [Papaver somniferum]